MILYIDTNVLLARFSPNEPSHEESKYIINAVERGYVEAFTSVLTLTEVASSVSRAYHSQRPRKEDYKEAVGVFMKKIATMRNLRFVPLGDEITMSFDGEKIELPSLLSVAIELGPKTGLKTLDNLHVAAATIASSTEGKQIDYFVTLDNDILRHGEEIALKIGIAVASPADIPLHID